MRTVAIYQAAGVKGGGTSYYELARAVYANDTVSLDAMSAAQKQAWQEQGIRVKGGTFVKPSAGMAFLDALRDDMEKGGQIFALDSGRGDEVPPSLFDVDPKTLRTLGDVPGHEFHGNQWTSGTGGTGGTTAYHGTLQHQLDSILKEGITASHSGVIWPGISEPGRTYLTGDFEDAQHWAGAAADRRRAEDEIRTPVVLKVVIPAAEAQRLKTDRHFESMGDNTRFQFQGDIKPEWIKGAWIATKPEDASDRDTPWVKVLEDMTDDVVVYVPFALISKRRDAEFNPDQPRDEHGRWVDAGGWEHTGIEWQQPTDPKTGRPIPIKVKTVEEAAALVLQGKVVEVDSPKKAYSLIDRLAKMGQEAAAKGKDAPQYDLCQISVAKTNMFCAESLRTKDFPQGIPRVEMPQLGGLPVKGSEADKLPKDEQGKVEGAQAFVTHLQGLGVKTSHEVVRSDSLRASQRELIGQKVAATMRKMEENREGKKTDNPKDKAIFISSDDYVVDGHHRWAASVAKDAADGHLGDSKMHVVRVNAPISEVLHLANAWSQKFGIQQAAGVQAQAKAIRAKQRPKK